MGRALDRSRDLDAQRRELQQETSEVVRSRALAGEQQQAQRRMDAELAALGEWERSHAEESRAALAEISEMAV